MAFYLICKYLGNNFVIAIKYENILLLNMKYIYIYIYIYICDFNWHIYI